jgi:hypothetical protein
MLARIISHLGRRVGGRLRRIVGPGPERGGRTERTAMQERFVRIHDQDGWSTGGESVSGSGSTLARTGPIRAALAGLLSSLDARVLLDVPCGDFNWLREVELPGIAYVGGDVVPALVAHNQQRYGDARRRFISVDLTRDPLPAADVILCRDCFIHFALDDIAAALANFKRSGARYLLTNTFPAVRGYTEIATGGFRRLNLERPPFGFPVPQARVLEASDIGKELCAWRLADLPALRVPAATGGRG